MPERPVPRQGDLFEHTPPTAVPEAPDCHWDYCPNCHHRLHNDRCKYRCPRCHYFMSCSDFD